MKRIGLMILVAATLSVGCMAAELNRVTVMGKPYYVYEVKKGDTMFGLAKKFGWDEKLIQSCNPDEMTTLHKGAKIYYPCDSRAGDTDVSTAMTKGNDMADSAGANAAGPVKHRIESGETLSSIARMYGVSLAKLKSLNPGAGDYIKKGDWLTISEGTSKSNDASKFHTVKPGDTLYGLAKANNVSVAALLKANPGISADNFRSGEIIVIPKNGTGITMEKKTVREEVVKGFRPYKVKKNDTWTTLAQQNAIPVEMLMEANKGIELKKNQYIGIPVLETVDVERNVAEEDTRDIDEIYQDVHGIDGSEKYPVINMAIVTDESNSRRDREILRGVLMAVDKLKNSGSKILLKVLEGEDADKCRTELAKFEPSLVVSTAERQLPAWITEYGKANSVPVVNLLDVKNEAFQTNPYVVQLITPPDYFNDEIAQWFHDRYEGYSLVFTGDEDSNDALAGSLKAIWEPNLVRSRSVEDLKTMPLNNNGKYLLYSYPTRRSDVSEFLDAVKEASTKAPLAKVSVVGRPNWIVYDDALAEKFHDADVQIPARFYMNKNSRTNSEFALSYRQMFDSTVPNTFPVYSAIGYDAATYFISGLSSSNGDINGIKSDKAGIQSEFSLDRPSNWSGMLNKAVYVVRFTPYDSVEKTVVK